MTITIQYDFDTGRYELMVSDGRMRAMPAGERLFRAPPLPDVAWAHPSLEAAQGDARKLQTYLDQVGAKKQTYEAPSNWCVCRASQRADRLK